MNNIFYMLILFLYKRDVFADNIFYVFKRDVSMNIFYMLILS